MLDLRIKSYDDVLEPRTVTLELSRFGLDTLLLAYDEGRRMRRVLLRMKGGKKPEFEVHPEVVEDVFGCKL